MLAPSPGLIENKRPIRLSKSSRFRGRIVHVPCIGWLVRDEGAGVINGRSVSAGLSATMVVSQLARTHEMSWACAWVRDRAMKIKASIIS